MNGARQIEALSRPADADTRSPAHLSFRTGRLAVDCVQVKQYFFIRQFLNVRPSLPMFAVKSPLDFLR